MTFQIAPSPSSGTNEKHKPRRSHQYPSRAVSYHGNPTKNGNDQITNGERSEQIDPPDQSGLHEQIPSLTLNGQEDAAYDEEEPPLPSPEIGSGSVMATARLAGSLAEILEAIELYEEFQEYCHDTPAWSYYMIQQISNIRHNIRSMCRAAGYVRYLREGGQGTAGKTGLERLAKEVFMIERQAQEEWKDIWAGFVKGKIGESGKEMESEFEREDVFREERMEMYRKLVEETYVRKMKGRLGGLEALMGEAEGMKGQLRERWEQLSKMTLDELDEFWSY